MKTESTTTCTTPPFQVMEVNVDTIKNEWLVSDGQQGPLLKNIFISYQFQQVSNPTGSPDYKFGMVAYQQYVRYTGPEQAELSFILLPDNFIVVGGSEFINYDNLVMGTMYVSFIELKDKINQMEDEYKYVRVFFHPNVSPSDTPPSITCRIQLTGTNLELSAQGKTGLSEVPGAQNIENANSTAVPEGESWLEMNPCPPNNIETTVEI